MLAVQAWCPALCRCVSVAGFLCPPGQQWGKAVLQWPRGIFDLVMEGVVLPPEGTPLKVTVAAERSGQPLLGGEGGGHLPSVGDR